MQRTAEMKKKTIEFYDGFAGQYKERHKDLPAKEIQNFADLVFAKAETTKTNVLDVGCGTGRDMEQMRAIRLNVFGIDASLEMCKLTRKNGLPVIQMDLESLAFRVSKIFDGIWARNSLLHSPPKLWPQVINNLCARLKPRSPFFLGCKESAGTGIEEEFKSTANGETYYCYWSLPKLLEMLEVRCPLRILNVEKKEKLDVFGERHYLDIFARRT